MHTVAVAVVLCAVALSAFAAVPADQITALPGWNQALPTKQYSGYLTFEGRKHIHYWFVESEGNPSTDPVTVWFNGGPGCSSLEGYLYEHGPFHINPTDSSQLYYNNYTWSKISNMLYLEAPVGVGFSYSDNANDYITNDEQTAADNLAALEVFLTSYPEFSTNPLYISGESYAGIYVPSLAYAIWNATQTGQTNMNLKGILVGNGCSGNEVGVCSAKGDVIRTQFCYQHGLFSTVTYDLLTTACDNFLDINTAPCQQALGVAAAEIGNVNIYDIYADCINNPTFDSTATSFTRAPGARHVGGPAECIDSIAANYYLNQASVQAALHVQPASFGNWSVCGNSIQYTSTIANEPASIYPTLVANYRVWIFNGDVDACVPYTDNEAWTSGMGYPVKEAWHPWSVNGQVGGYATEYNTNGFTFATVKGAGHMVPQYQPAAALYLFTQFLSGKTL